MEATSHPDLSPRGILESQLREGYGRVAYSHKTHEKDADRYFARGRQLKTTQIVLSAITTGGLVAVLFGDNTDAAGLSAIAATIQLILNAYSKELNLGELAQKHAEVASKLWHVREGYMSLLTDLRCGISEADVRTRRDELQAELASLYQNAPRTSARAYSMAQKALQINEELTFSDQELDRLLPTGLRSSHTTKHSHGAPDDGNPNSGVLTGV